jgi:thiol-disulfide isomerase/thioredoxin
MLSPFPTFPISRWAVSRIGFGTRWRLAPTLVAAALLTGFAGAAAAKTKPGPIIPADSDAIKRALADARARPGTTAVLVNVWATWCEPCREEMPDLVRLTRDPKARGVRLLLVSADSQSESAAVAAYLGKLGIKGPSYLKTGDDMKFIDGLDPTWDGTIPTSWLYDAGGRRAHTWNGKISYPELMREIAALEKAGTTTTTPPTPPQQTQTRRTP